MVVHHNNTGKVNWYDFSVKTGALPVKWDSLLYACVDHSFIGLFFDKTKQPSPT